MTMDPDLVRLILVVLGVLLVVGIYLWDRYKHANLRLVRQRRRAPVAAREASYDTELPGESVDVSERREPSIDELPESVPSMRIEDERKPAAPRAALDPEPVDLGDWTAAPREQDPQFSMDLNFDAHGEGDYLSRDPALSDEVERKIVVINLAARSGSFNGAAIAEACAASDLELGEMAIFHRHEPRAGRVLFSMASMVEPGSFPADEMQTFETPGLSLFTQLPGVRDGVEIYNDMLATANRLAAALDAEVQDERHNKLTKQMEKHTRDAIVEHRRKIRLARSRH